MAHAVGIERLLDGGGQVRRAHADIEHDGTRAGVEAVQMRLEEKNTPVMEAQALPDAVAEYEACIEHGHLCILARDQRTVQIDACGNIARVFGEILASGHRAIPIRQAAATLAGGAEPPTPIAHKSQVSGIS